jgi:hypothetical protein
VNVVGQFGATFALSRVKQIALEHGLSETADGDLVAFARDGNVEFVIRRMSEETGKPTTTYVNGLTLALDLPQVADAPSVFADMVQVGHAIAQQLGGQLVDDNRRPLSDAGLATIRRTVEKVCGDMEAHGIPAGGALARRLFS